MLASLVFLTSSAPAGELGSCTKDCDCTPETSEGYDSCTIITASELLGVDDPHQLRQALRLTTIYNANTNKYEVSYNVSTADTKILTLHSNRGDWQSLTHLNDYLNALVFGPAGPPEPGLGRVDFCDLTDLSFQQQTGFFGRWDQEEQGWTPFQLQNVIFAAVSDPSGVVHVDGEPFVPLSGELQDEYCDAGSNTDGVAAEQCSFIEELPGGGDDGLRVCGKWVEYPTETGPRAQTDLDELTLNGGRFVIIEEFESILNNEPTYRIREVYETLRLQSQFYWGSVTQGNAADTDYLLEQTELHQSYELANGVCSKGEVDEGLLRFELKTSVGGAPAVCPLNE
jgi:hypothetical protein